MWQRNNRPGSLLRPHAIGNNNARQRRGLEEQGEERRSARTEQRRPWRAPAHQNDDGVHDEEDHGPNAETCGYAELFDPGVEETGKNAVLSPTSTLCRSAS